MFLNQIQVKAQTTKIFYFIFLFFKCLICLFLSFFFWAGENVMLGKKFPLGNIWQNCIQVVAPHVFSSRTEIQFVLSLYFSFSMSWMTASPQKHLTVMLSEWINTEVTWSTHYFQHITLFQQWNAAPEHPGIGIGSEIII